MSWVAVSFVVFLLLFLGVGVYSASRKQETTEDYLVASREVSPWLVALSAVATNNSGFMFIGLIGEVFLSGLSAMWVMVGWVVGDYLMWVAKIPDQLRARSASTGTVTIPSFLGHGVPSGRGVTRVAGAVTLVFLALYAAAQLNAGSKALHALFGWDYAVGAVLGALIVVIYCFAGGIRASIWTDAAQSIVMFVAMLLLCGIALSSLGGPAAMWASLESQDPQLTHWRPAELQWGFTLFMAGWLVAGIGVVGQPHIMVRTMALDAVENMQKARRIYVVWNLLFAAAAILVGLAARAWLDPATIGDAELALPLLAKELLPAVLVGLVLAGLFAATMSTADSQVLASSAALTQDLFPRVGQDYRWAKTGTLLITAAVLGFALQGGSVFSLVVLAWSSLAGGLGPLLILRALGRPVHGRLGMLMILGALGAVILWRFVLGWTGAVYDALPAMLAGFLIYGAGRTVWPDEQD